MTKSSRKGLHDPTGDSVLGTGLGYQQQRLEQASGTCLHWLVLSYAVVRNSKEWSFGGRRQESSLSLSRPFPPRRVRPKLFSVAAVLGCLALPGDPGDKAVSSAPHGLTQGPPSKSRSCGTAAMFPHLVPYAQQGGSAVAACRTCWVRCKSRGSPSVGETVAKPLIAFLGLKEKGC